MRTVNADSLWRIADKKRSKPRRREDAE